LEHVVGDPALRADLRVRGPRRAAQFDWTTAARVTRRALEQAFDPDYRTPLPSRRKSAAS
jgi:hypothetical protein